MRKLILIAAMSLLASQAHAGSRSLSLAATNNASQTTEQPAPPAAPQATQTATTTPAPTPPTQSVTVPTATPAKPVADTSKPTRREPSTEARFIRELHRHGIYW